LWETPLKIMWELLWIVRCRLRDIGGEKGMREGLGVGSYRCWRIREGRLRVFSLQLLRSVERVRLNMVEQGTMEGVVRDLKTALYKVSSLVLLLYT